MAFPKEMLKGLKHEGYIRDKYNHYSSGGYYQVNYKKPLPNNASLHLTLTQYGSGGNWTYKFYCQARVKSDSIVRRPEFSQDVPFTEDYESFVSAQHEALKQIGRAV